MYYIYILFNYLDALLPVEKVKTSADGVQMDRFSLGLKLFNVLISLSVYYAVMKFIQFVASALVGVVTDEHTF
ncbi:hypothetical protein [Ekhidna sp.]|uniref:hypothetical protein n=1 Tax=Ekhidna sp. TaxID=2608089 RepID=UPI003BA89B1A